MTHIASKHKRSLCHGLVLVLQVVLLSQVPVLCVPLRQARDDDEAQHHQVDASENFVDQS